MLQKEEALDAECAVCHQPIAKDRIHYGGVSCYSCRAFFRRNTQREELPHCKSDGNCQITYIDRKQCSACRYVSCLRIGMKPELVLSEEDKKRRFKKFLKKKETGRQNHITRNIDNNSHPSSESTPPPLEPLPSARFISPLHNNFHILMANRNIFNSNFFLEKFNSNEKESASNNSPLNFFSLAQKPKFLQQEPAAVSKDYEALNYFKNQGRTKSSTLVSPDQSRSFSFNQVNKAALFIQNPDFSTTANTAERQSVINFSFASIKEEPLEEPENLSLKRSSSDEEDEMNYVHKKFRVNSEKSDDEEAGPINLHQPQRQSVIMHASSAVLA